MKKIILKIAFALIIAITITACASLPTSKPEPPTVKLKGIKPLKIGFREQTLLFTLNVSNPNSFDLPMRSLHFIAELGGSKVAQGVSNESVILPANGAATLSIEVVSRASQLFKQLMLLASKEASSLNYDVKGFLKLTNWPMRIPFSVDGIIDGSSLLN